MTPTRPCFVVGTRGYFSFEPTFSSQQTATLLGVLGGFFEKSVVYDAEGHKWQTKGIDSLYKRTWWTLLLANTVYNPRVTVTLVWREPKTYALEELKLAYSKAVDKDDDILTQFVEAGELKRKISESESFVSLVEVYRWMETDHTYQEGA
jgi:hypothetical protein